MLIMGEILVEGVPVLQAGWQAYVYLFVVLTRGGCVACLCSIFAPSEM